MKWGTKWSQGCEEARVRTDVDMIEREEEFGVSYSTIAIAIGADKDLGFPGLPGGVNKDLGFPGFQQLSFFYSSDLIIIILVRAKCTHTVHTVAKNINKYH